VLGFVLVLALVLVLVGGGETERDAGAWGHGGTDVGTDLTLRVFFDAEFGAAGS
jgi:hypothetical protein